MNTGFDDALKIPKGKKIKSPWNFDCPPYDQRTSCFVDAGSNYGVGKKQPIGKEIAKNSNAIPKGRPNTLKTNYVHKGNPGLVDINEED